MIPAPEALDRLREGNRRFVSEQHGSGIIDSDERRRRELVSGQTPFAIILGCSDSRVPAELVFDQGLGDLFVIRVAGNIAAPSQIGSAEFAAANFGTRLVVVLGHSSCGAILAAVDSIERPREIESPNLQVLVDRIRPPLEAMLAGESPPAGDDIVPAAVRANVRAAAGELRENSPVLRRLIEEEGLLVVGAEYSLETGIVDFFDGVPGSG